MGGEISMTVPDPGQQEVLDAWLQDARDYDIDLDDLASIGTAYDEYIVEVMQQEPDDRQDPTAFCTMIGMAMGEYLVRHSDLQWRIVTDDQGTDLGLANPEETGVIFPADPVAGAWEQQQVGWLPEWAEQLLVSVRSQPV